jgi:radical SAM superfamily enzyme YgiQ (UPF0313 family)
VFLPEPLGLELVGTVLRQAGHEVVLLDLRLEGPTYVDGVMRRWQPDAVGIACGFTSELVRAKQIAQKARRFAPRAFVFVGGHHASRTPEDFAPEDADAVVLGEAEIGAVPLLEALERGGDLSNVPSLAIPATAGIRRTVAPIDGKFLDLEKLPRPDRSLVSRYRQRYHLGFARPVFSVETTRGCPYTCNFCSVWEMYARSYRTRTPERVVADIADCDGEEVFFTDDLFFLDAKRAIALGEAVRDAKLKKFYTAQIRADSVAKHPEIVPLWREAGLKRVFVGMEAVDEKGLISVDKRSHIEQTEKAIEILSRHGVEIQGSFIAMLDWGPEDFQRLSEYVRTRPIKYPSFAVLTPLPGTKLHRDRYDELTSHDPELYDVFHAVLPTKLPLDEFYRQFAQLYRKTYSNTQILSLVLNATKAIARGDFMHLLHVAKHLRHLTNPQSYLIAHREAERRARSGVALATGIRVSAAA